MRHCRLMTCGVGTSQSSRCPQLSRAECGRENFFVPTRTDQVDPALPAHPRQVTAAGGQLWRPRSARFVKPQVGLRTRIERSSVFSVFAARSKVDSSNAGMLTLSHELVARVPAVARVWSESCHRREFRRLHGGTKTRETSSTKGLATYRSALIPLNATRKGIMNARLYQTPVGCRTGCGADILELRPGPCGPEEGFQRRLVDLCRLDALGLCRRITASSRNGPTNTASPSR